jgi:hypothetical protein
VDNAAGSLVIVIAVEGQESHGPKCTGMTKTELYGVCYTRIMYVTSKCVESCRALHSPSPPSSL